MNQSHSCTWYISTTCNSGTFCISVLVRNGLENVPCCHNDQRRTILFFERFDWSSSVSEADNAVVGTKGGRPRFLVSSGGSLCSWIIIITSLSLPANSKARVLVTLHLVLFWSAWRSQLFITARFSPHRNTRLYHFGLLWSTLYKAISMSKRSTTPIFSLFSLMIAGQGMSAYLCCFLSKRLIVVSGSTAVWDDDNWTEELSSHRTTAMPEFASTDQSPIWVNTLSVYLLWWCQLTRYSRIWASPGVPEMRANCQNTSWNFIP